MDKSHLKLISIHQKPILVDKPTSAAQRRSPTTSQKPRHQSIDALSSSIHIVLHILIEITQEHRPEPIVYIIEIIHPARLGLEHLELPARHTYRLQRTGRKVRPLLSLPDPLLRLFLFVRKKNVVAIAEQLIIQTRLVYGRIQERRPSFSTLQFHRYIHRLPGHTYKVPIKPANREG